MKRALVVGSGNWGRRVSHILAEKHDFKVRQTSARDFGLLNLTSDEEFDLAVLATMPSIQESMVSKIVEISRTLWLEKPIASTYKNALEVVNAIENSKRCYSLVNFSWTFSRIWREFLGFGPVFKKINRIEMMQVANGFKHEYMNPCEDYGSHDISLLFDWAHFNSLEPKKIKLTERTTNQFCADLQGVRIQWSLEFEPEARKMIWRIFWDNGEISEVDFYKGEIRGRNELLLTNQEDNICSLLNNLNYRNPTFARRNHEIALNTKKFFDKW